MEKKKTPCDFCQYHTASGCTVRPNSYYCKDAKTEFFAWLESIKKKGNNHVKR